jgi:formamidopyrimidine-DNA glycosylase
MQVPDGLASPLAIIGQDPVTTLVQTSLPRDRLRQGEEFSAESGVVEIPEAGDMLFRHDEDVRWGSRLDVVECDRTFRFRDKGRPELAIDDLAENAVIGHSIDLPCSNVTRPRAGSSLTHRQSSMPELPEVETVRRGLEQSILGRRIDGLAYLDFAEVIGRHSAQEFEAIVAGRQIRSIHRRGKYLWLAFDDAGGLLIHLRMTGQVSVQPLALECVRFERVRLVLDDGTSLVFADQRKFGRILSLSEDEWLDLNRRLGIEPLDVQFNPEFLAAALGRRKAPVKAVLLDQSTIAGIGNIYADEALFEACIHPALKARDVPREQVSALHQAVQHVLRSGIQNRGTTFSSFRDTRGREGSNQEALLVYGKGRLGAACPRCGTTLTCIQVAGRSSHICPACQVLPLQDRI